MQEFKVGQKVTIGPNSIDVEVGTVFTVVENLKVKGVWIDVRDKEVMLKYVHKGLQNCFADFTLYVEDKPKRFQVGDRVISTKNTPSVPEGFVGYIVKNDQSNYEYAVESLGHTEYFNEDELELLSASKEKMQELKDLTDKIDKVPPSDYAFLTYGPKSGKEEHTGGSVDYYKVFVANPTTLEQPYYAEANDIIESLGLTFAEGNLLKAVWRIAADRNGKKKKGNNSIYDAEKLVFFAERVLAQEKAK
jgi:hypothetical protein